MREDGRMADSMERIRRHPERARTDRAELDAVLDDGDHIGSLSTVTSGEPWVVPMLYARAGDRILLHGSTGAGALRHVAAGARAVLCVTHLDAWVYGHTLFDSSANYRSAVVRGELIQLAGDEAAAALTALSEGVLPGRSRALPPHTRKQLAATQALAMEIVPGQWTVKVRAGGPGVPEPGDEPAPGVWAGVLPVRTAYGQPEAAAYLTPGTPVPASVLSRAGDGR
jgi:hypothetical protein